MTLEEALNCPKGMSFDEYKKILAEKKRKDRRIRKLSNEQFDLEDALQVLEDEKGSERYLRKAARLEEIKRELSQLKGGA